MRASCVSCLGSPRAFALLLALACVACAAPARVEEPANVATPSKKPESGAVKEPAAPPNAPPPRAATRSASEQELDKGIKSYEEGEYKVAAKQLQVALDLGLGAKRDQAKAHKYLAFIVCVSGREKSCRNEFRKALDADPKFELEPAEAGHPIWGPALRSVKAERAAKAKSK
jgi:Tfp pilus assembly protein PilF